MSDDDSEFWSARTVLAHIEQFAQAYRAAPWLVLMQCFARAAAHTDPGINVWTGLGPDITLNLVHAAVGDSEDGKDRAAGAARDAIQFDSVVNLPPPFPAGSGEGFAMAHGPQRKDPKDPASDIVVTNPNVLIMVHEVDTIAALASRKDNTWDVEMRQFWSGQTLGRQNAGKDSTQRVPAGTYRGAVIINVQPERAAPLMDGSGGTRQRVLWGLARDPRAPRQRPERPEPLVVKVPTALPPGGLRAPESVIAAMDDADWRKHRGLPCDDPSLLGHQRLTRAKLAAIFGMFEYPNRGEWRLEESDWELAGLVMSKSFQTYDGIVQKLAAVASAANRAKAHAIADRDDIVSDRKLERAKQAILRKLGRSVEAPTRELRSALKADLRGNFDTAISELADDGRIFAIEVDGGRRYRLTPEVHAGTEVHASKPQVDAREPKYPQVPPATVTELDSRRSPDLHQPKLSCAKWFDNYVIQLRSAGETTLNSFAARSAAAAEGYSENLLHQATAAHPDVVLLERKGGNVVWSITGEPTRYQPVLSWFNDWLDALPANIAEIDKAALKQDCGAAGHSWESLRRDVVQRCPRVESVKNGRSTIWRITKPTEREDAS